MKKSLNKKTVIVVLAFFLVLSVGYALFSDTITIEGTAIAQGTFDIEATCYTTIPDEVKNALEDANIEAINNNPDNGYNNETCTVNNDTVTYTVGLEYPGAAKTYAVKLTNVGTIEAALSVNDLWTDDLSNTIKTYNAETKELISTETDSRYFFRNHGMALQRADGNYMDLNNPSEEDIAYFLDSTDENNAKYLLKVGANWYWIFEAYWPTEETYSQDGVYYEAIQTVEFPFEQYNG